MPQLTGSCSRQGKHSYPKELVDFILKSWNDGLFRETLAAAGVDPDFRMPEREVLERIVSTAYQASLMRDEERPVRFRLMVRDPEGFSGEEGPPTGLHRICFVTPRPYNQHELNKLAPAADFYRTLIGVSIEPDGGVHIWGMVNSGTRWMQAIYGGRKAFPPLPSSLVVYVTDPGQILVGIGTAIVASLTGGQINCPSLDVFDSQWLSESFALVRSEMWELHQEARRRARSRWAQLDPGFASTVAQQVVRRIISVIRNSHHGGTIIYLPPELEQEILTDNPYMTIRYQFRKDEPRQRFRTLMLRIMNTFAEVQGRVDDGGPAGWQEYVSCRDEAIYSLDEAIFDVAHFIAALSATDGAVIMNKHQELIGFGGVISGNIDKMETVVHALDTEGNLTEVESSEGVGTRHLAAYRLCRELHDALAIIISQDGNVRFVKWYNGFVTYWDQTPTGVPGF